MKTEGGFETKAHSLQRRSSELALAQWLAAHHVVSSAFDERPTVTVRAPSSGSWTGIRTRGLILLRRMTAHGS